MDTYFHVSLDCIKCGRCVKACHERGHGELVGGRGMMPDTYNENLCCHRCGQFCKDVCHYGAISIVRW